MASSGTRTVWVSLTYLLVAAVSVAMIAVGATSQEPWAGAVLGAGLAGVIVAVALAPIALLLAGRGSESRSATSADAQRRVIELLNGIHQQLMVSDEAKRVVFRDQELDLVRDRIEDHIATGQYDAALEICDQMSKVFGSRQEVEELRSRILHSRNEHYEVQVSAAVDQFDELLAHRDWAHAYDEAARIRRLYPDSAIVADLDRRIHEARQAAKNDLEGQLLEAAGREDVELAMEILRELDRYLTREEAARLQEVAEGVVVKHRDNLGVQFRLAVNDHRWAEAARIGETIVLEFPNTKMADEVRSMIEVLRTRATQAAVAEG